LIFLVSCSALYQGTEGTAEGFDFTDEEDLVLPQEEGFDFTDEEGLVIPQEEGFDFTDEEDKPLQENNLMLPPEGVSNWLVTHEEGTVTCTNVTIPIWGNDDEMVTLNVGAGGASLELSGLDGESSMVYAQLQSTEFGSEYVTEFIPAGANSPVTIKVVFSNLTDGNTANHMEGFITGNPEGCYLSRSFFGSLTK
jgi:hypothetical protein